MLTEKQEEQLRKLPIIEQKIAKSQDGKFVIDRTVITWIKPVSYYEKVMGSEGEEKV